MRTVQDLDHPEIPIVRACEGVGVSRATLYRQTSPGHVADLRPRAASARRLTDAERQAVVDALHSEELVDQPPQEVYAELLSRGTYLASIRTMYCVLASLGESSERRPQRSPAAHAKPTLLASAPNHVWTWDITKMRGPAPGVLYCLYAVLELYSASRWAGYSRSAGVPTSPSISSRSPSCATASSLERSPSMPLAALRCVPRASLSSSPPSAWSAVSVVPNVSDDNALETCRELPLVARPALLHLHSRSL